MRGVLWLLVWLLMQAVGDDAACSAPELLLWSPLESAAAVLAWRERVGRTGCASTECPPGASGPAPESSAASELGASTFWRLYCRHCSNCCWHKSARRVSRLSASSSSRMRSCSDFNSCVIPTPQQRPGVKGPTAVRDATHPPGPSTMAIPASNMQPVEGR